MPPSREWAAFRILADEDVSFKLIRPLKKLGIDIKPVTKGWKNGRLFGLAIEESRILLTHDNDFLDPLRYPASKTHGIIIIKIHPPFPADLVQATTHLFERLSPDQIEGKLVLLSGDGFTIE